MEPRVIKRTIDLSLEVQRDPAWGQRLMLKGSVLADRLELSVRNAGAQVDMTGLEGVTYFKTPNGMDVVKKCTLAGNVLSVEFPAEAYAFEGTLVVLVFLSDGVRDMPLYREAFDIGEGRSDVLIDPDDIVPNLSVVLQIVQSAKDATAVANNAANAANTAAEKIDNMTVSAIEGESADAQISEKDGAKHITLRLPRGKEGAPGGYYTPVMNGTMLEVWHGSNEDMPSLAVGIDLKGKNFTVLGTYETLDALTAAVPEPEQGDVYNVGAAEPYDMYMWDTTGGDDDNPIVSPGEWISIGKSGYSDPGGSTGGAVQSVNGQTGAVVLTASDVNALPNTYTPPNQTAEQVGADPKGTANQAVSSHNTDNDAHNDLRVELSKIADRLNAFFDSDDATLDELSEIIAYIKSNKTLIDSITTSKVNVSDIVDNLTTNVGNRPLSAAQGVVLKALIDAITVPTKLSQLSGDSTHRVVTDAEKTAWNAKSNFSGSYPDLTNKPTIPTVPTKVSAFENDAGYLTQHQDISGKEDRFDPTVYGLPVLYLTGDTTGMDKDNEVSLSYVYGDLTGNCTMKWQGSSSLAYDKKNYTIKLVDKTEIVKAWGAQKKYCLKANFIDHTHARNIVSARLWGQIVASRSPANSTLKACPNYGAVDGFPIVVMLNGEFHGLYTWNIPKDAWMFNMGSGTQEAVICADEATNPAVDFRVHSKVDGDDHELEYVTDENSTAWVATSLNNVIDLCVNSYGADIDTTIAQYLDWESAIDYYILTVLVDGRDMTGKNYIMATWNGTKWVFSAYDMDSTYGLQWAGKEFYPANDGVSFVKFRSNRVMELIYRFKTNALKARYKALRQSVLSEENINVMFENFTCGIPSQIFAAEARKWPSLPSTSVANIDQLLRWLHRRLAVCDKWVEELPAQETPVAPSSREGDVVALSTDESGSIYNGTGYKDGYVASVASGGAASETAVDGMSVSGFIPITKDNVIKVTTDAWNASPTPSRIIYYNANLEPMAFYTQHGYVSTFNGYDNKTSIQSKDKQSVTYGSDGMTTLNIAFGANCTDVMYCRINATCPGSKLKVIREGEVPDHAPDVEPEETIDNYITVAIDTDGSLFNGTGYMDGKRISTSDPDGAYSDKTGMFITGYIPVKMTDIIRVTSSTWGTSPSNAKITFYNAQFKAMAFYTANGFVSTFNGYTSGLEGNITSLKSKDLQSVTVGDDGMTTLNLVFGDECTDVAYFRYDGCGSGANCVITLN